LGFVFAMITCLATQEHKNRLALPVEARWIIAIVAGSGMAQAQVPSLNVLNKPYVPFFGFNDVFLLNPDGVGVCR
jgi:hypothetical protein